MNANQTNDPQDADSSTPELDETAPVTGLPYAAAGEPEPTVPPTTVLDEEPGSSSWRHPVNVGHLVMGVAFAGLVLVWALITSDAIDDDEVRWLMPVPWVAAGALGLVATTWSNLKARKARELQLP